MHLYGGGAGVRSWLLDCWVFMPGGWVLPAFIAMVVTKVDLPWVAERAIRLMGLVGKKPATNMASLMSYNK